MKIMEAEADGRLARPLSKEEQRAWAPLVQSMLHLLATLDDELKRGLDLSHLDYGILMLLRIDPRRRRRMTELATTFGVEPNVITYRVQRMEARGWVRRGRCAVDKRGVYAFLTEDGLALVERATPLHVAGVRWHFLDHVSPAQLAVLAEVFGPLHQRQIAGPAMTAADEEPGPTIEGHRDIVRTPVPADRTASDPSVRDNAPG